MKSSSLTSWNNMAATPSHGWGGGHLWNRNTADRRKVRWAMRMPLVAFRDRAR